ncbi:FecR family protein [Dyadobacter tibetensis]|uniref:FecR family protein n=1 Tax=Dyadobacter tibetensis TaxID=1211851 RepID=UPI000472806A|nr:FecR domain-containing protein [Dyadobacter tibetensis]
MDAQISKAILFDHFAGNATVMQRRMIDEWVKTPENEELFFKYLEEWESSRPQFPIDLNRAETNFRQKLRHYDIQEKVQQTTAPTKWVRTALWIAASLLLLATSAVLMKDTIRYREFSTDAGEVRSWQLSEGSVVTLNANSTLRVPRWNFGISTREVTLKGEAEFKVTHLKNDQKFIVRTDNQVDVIVLGTEFTVYNRNRKTEVVLKKGKVRIEKQKGETRNNLEMVPGDMISVEKTGSVHKRRLKAEVLYAPWKDDRFEFDQTPLFEVATRLEEHYNYKILIVDKSLKELTISGSFKASNGPELIESIAKILDVSYSIQGNKIEFKPTS